jgi:predicted enzyme related to lactoylglutathione lyase
MVPDMALRANMVTIDCADPGVLAPFWTQALGYRILHDFEGWYVLLGGDSPDAIQVGLQRVPEPWGGKNRVHLDLRADDRTAEVSRLTDLGAKIVDEQRMPGFAWSVLEDPEGNVFCVGGAEA